MFNSKELKIVLSAVDNASKEIKKVNVSLESVASFAKKAALGLGVAAGGFAYVLKETTDASNELNNALIGLNSVANAFNQDADAAKQAAMDLASDGLMSVKSAADSLKNLLATGFSLPEAINLMKGFKDAAAFNRQGTLEFGQAIEGATQGIKNQNSILVDNAGITKNLSLILKEAGFSQNDLMNVTSDAAVRQALYNGILKEASIFQGDAARSAGTLSGQQAALATQIFMVKAAIGDALAPVMQLIIQQIMSAIQAVGGPEGLKNQFLKYQDVILGVVQTMIGMVKIVVTAVDWFMKLADILGTIIYKAGQAYDSIMNLKNALMDSTIVKAWGNLPENLSQTFGGGKAIGGPVRGGTSYLVGERGPELFTPSSSGSITPNNKLGGLTINITGNTLLDSRAAERIGDMIVSKLGMSTKYAY
jgi:hypothetical protein